eukprot:7037968-Pyramimonas_sp.AAC.1
MATGQAKPSSVHTDTGRPKPPQGGEEGAKASDNQRLTAAQRVNDVAAKRGPDSSWITDAESS